MGVGKTKSIVIYVILVTFLAILQNNTWACLCHISCVYFVMCIVRALIEKLIAMFYELFYIVYCLLFFFWFF